MITADREKDIFYRLVIYFFTADDHITEAEKDTISTYLRLTSDDRTAEHVFSIISNSLEKKIKFDVSELKQISYQSRFYYVVQALALLTGDGLNELEKKAAEKVIEKCGFTEDDLCIVKDVFFRKDFTHPRLLSMGPDSKNNDIVKTEKEHSAVLFVREEFFFILSMRSGGLITIDDHHLFDHILYKIDIKSRLFIHYHFVSYANLLIRSELKKGNYQELFSIVKEKEHVYRLVRGDVSYKIGYVFIRGLRMLVINYSDEERLSIGPAHTQTNKKSGNMYSGSIDDTLKIGNRSFFNLSDSIASLISLKDISSSFLDEKKIRIGNTVQCQIFLPFYTSRKTYIDLTLNERGLWELDGTHNIIPLYINNHYIPTDRALVKNGDLIQMGRKTIVFDPSNIRVFQSTIFCIEGRDITLHYKTAPGVNGVSFENENKNLTCIMGPSGCGKSTLLKILGGYLKPEKNRSVQFNHIPFYENFDNFKNFIGYVSQDDMLFENMTIYENLFYYGRIKQPYIPQSELRRRIDYLLVELGLAEKQNIKAGNAESRVLSGGERKRLNIALELLTDCDLLLLDEPTSGLSSYDTQKTMALLEGQARVGKIIYVVIHQPSHEIFSRFSHLLLLDRDGYLAYHGPASRAYDYFSEFSTTRFKLQTPEHILEVLEAVRMTPDGETIYELQDGHKIPMRVKTPSQWNADFKIRRGHYRTLSHQKDDHKPFLPPRQHLKYKDKFTRFGALFGRNFLNKMRDRSALMVSLLIPAFLAVALGGVLRIVPDGQPYHWSDNTEFPKFLFLSAVILIFLAISNSVNEVMKDRVILNKERLTGYSASSYLLSKFFTLTAILFYQTFIYAFFSFIVLEIPVFIIYNGVFHASLFLSFFLFSFVASLSASSLGLFVSSFIKSEKVAFYAVPLLIIPQIIFGGLFLNFNDIKGGDPLKPEVPAVCSLIHARWVYEGYMNIFRYRNAGKVRAYRNLGFYKRYGNQLNAKIMDEFYSYHLRKDSLSGSFTKEKNKKIEEKMKRYFTGMAHYESGKIPWSVFKGIYRETGKNYFLHKKKVFLGNIYETIAFNRFVLLGFLALYFFCAVFRLEYIRKQEPGFSVNRDLLSI